MIHYSDPLLTPRKGAIMKLRKVKKYDFYGDKRLDKDGKIMIDTKDRINRILIDFVGFNFPANKLSLENYIKDVYNTEMRCWCKDHCGLVDITTCKLVEKLSYTNSYIKDDYVGDYYRTFDYKDFMYSFLGGVLPTIKEYLNWYLSNDISVIVLEYIMPMYSYTEPYNMDIWRFSKRTTHRLDSTSYSIHLTISYSLTIPNNCHGRNGVKCDIEKYINTNSVRNDFYSVHSRNNAIVNILDHYIRLNSVINGDRFYGYEHIHKIYKLAIQNRNSICEIDERHKRIARRRDRGGCIIM
jgi:hypothetical protein